MRRKKAKCPRTVRTKKYETSYSTHVCPQRIFVGFCKISRQTGQKNFLSMSWEFGKTLALAILSIVSQEQKPVICLAWSQISQKLTSPRFRVLDWVFESSGFSYQFQNGGRDSVCTWNKIHSQRSRAGLSFWWKILSGLSLLWGRNWDSVQHEWLCSASLGKHINIFFSPTLSEIFRTNTLNTFERLLRSVQNRYPYWS